MALIITKIDLQEFKKDFERKKSVLKFSLIFNDQEKQDVLNCYNDLIEIADKKLTENIDVVSHTL